VEFVSGGRVLRAFLRRYRVGEGEEEQGEGNLDSCPRYDAVDRHPDQGGRNDRGREERSGPPVDRALAAGVAQNARESCEEDDHEASRRRLLDVPPRHVDQGRDEDDPTSDAHHAREHTTEHPQAS
jgi:hypothetical protein